MPLPTIGAQMRTTLTLATTVTAKSDAGSFRAPGEEYEVSYSQHPSRGGYRGPGGMGLLYALPQTYRCPPLLLALMMAMVQASLRPRCPLCPAGVHQRCQRGA